MEEIWGFHTKWTLKNYGLKSIELGKSRCTMVMNVKIFTFLVTHDHNRQGNRRRIL